MFPLTDGYFLYRITPIFTVSSVSGENLDLLRKFLNLLSPSQSMVDQEMLAQENTEYQVCFFSPIKTGFLEGAGEGGGGFGAPPRISKAFQINATVLKFQRYTELK